MSWRSSFLIFTLEKTEGVVAVDKIKMLLEEITDILAAMTPEERLRWFKGLDSELNFRKEIGDTTYLVRTFFDANSSEDMVEKTNRILGENLPC